MIQPHMGLVIAEDRGRLIKNKALALPISFDGNHFEMIISMAGYTPPSATPSKKRMSNNCQSFLTIAVKYEITPQATIDQRINFFALRCSAICPPGACNTI